MPIFRMSIKDLTVAALVGAIGWAIQIFLPSIGPVTIWYIVLFYTITILLLPDLTFSEALGIGVAHGIVGVFASKSPVAWLNVISNPARVIIAWALYRAVRNASPRIKRLSPFFVTLIDDQVGSIIFIGGVCAVGFIPWSLYPWYLAVFFVVDAVFMSILCQFLFPVILRAYVRVAPEMKGKFGMFGV